MSVHILVVDDEADVASLFRQRFRREIRDGRFALEFALSADEALRKVEREAERGGERGRCPFSILLSDVNMPGMSGLDLLQAMKSGFPHLPVLMVTAYADEHMRRTAVERGADGLLSKPIDFGLLRSEIEMRTAPRHH